jgi:nitroimidazol reductase NimA-like FMN-containing flavoprotein (pyridoxamine 5'-phosphate oxidase superfamily)
VTAVKRKGPWSQHEIDRFLAETRVPIRLACNGGSGHPLLLSLWFAPQDGKLWCATQESSSVVAHLRRDPRCAFEVAVETAPYRGVRGQGVATLHDDRGEHVLRTLIGRYLSDPDSEFARWLLRRAAQETAIAIEPRALLSWDYRERMGHGP